MLNVVVDSGSIFEMSYIDSHSSNSNTFIETYRSFEVDNKSIFILINPFFIDGNRILTKFKDSIDLVCNRMVSESSNHFILNAFNSLIDSTKDFIDSIHTSNDQRERVVHLTKEIREQTNLLVNNQDKNLLTDSNDMDFSRLFRLSPLLNTCDALKKTVGLILILIN